MVFTNEATNYYQTTSKTRIQAGVKVRRNGVTIQVISCYWSDLSMAYRVVYKYLSKGE